MHNSLPVFALRFSTQRHGDQVRKYTGEPYITHPFAVFTILQQLYPNASDAMLTAALLHDVVEDTDTTIEEVEELFGTNVSVLVGWLTDVSKPEDGNRAVRKELDRQHTAQSPFEAQIIKCADIIHNSTNILAYDKGFAATYIPEMRQKLITMRPEVQQTPIYLKAWDIISPNN